MPQLSLYLDDTAMEELRVAAQREDLSLSQYARECIASQGNRSWPQSFWATFGALTDTSFQEPAELDAAFDGALPGFE